MGERKEYIIINKIIDYCKSARKYVQRLTYEEYIENELIISHTVLCLQQIGELVSRLSDDFRDNHPDVPWSKIRGLRNHMVHNYEGIRYNIVWNILQTNLPELFESMNKLLAELKENK